MTQRTKIDLPCGVFSVLADTPWLGGCIANTGRSELRAVGMAGSVAPAAGVELTADQDCVVSVDVVARPRATGESWTWNRLAQTPTSHVGCLVLEPSTPARLEGPSARHPLQTAARHGDLTLIIRRLDTGPDTIAVAASLLTQPQSTEAPAHVHA
jgi:hypothetical protein